MQETLDALVERVARLTQQDTETKQLQHDLARLTQRPSASPVPPRHSEESPHLCPREQRKLDRLIEMVTHLPNAPFHCALVILLLAHEGEDLSYAQIAQALHYEQGTVRHRTTTALREEGVIARATSVTGYTSRFSAYCDTRFPGVRQEVIRQALVVALVPYTEEQGAER